MIIPILHSIYVIYVLNYFKTTYNLAHPITYFNSKLLFHPIGKSNFPTSKVCKLGNILSWGLALFILIRGFLLPNYNKILKQLSLVGLILCVMLSMLNFNVVVYLIPHFIIEILYQKNYIYK